MRPAAAQDAMSMPLADIAAQAPGLPPVSLYQLAARLFGDGRRDEAVMWFYVAQLRARYRLTAEPGLPPDAEPALYASLNATVGRMINEWAFGDVQAAAAHMQAALDWDAAHANALTPKDAHGPALAQVRAGLEALRRKVLAEQDDIRRQRVRNGLVNR